MMNATFNLILFDRLNRPSRFSNFPPRRAARSFSSPTESRGVRPTARAGMGIAH
jgi:hypothetical protein